MSDRRHPPTSLLACALGLAGLLLAGPCQAEETRLICSGTVQTVAQVATGRSTNPYTGAQETDTASIPVETAVVREIRFDEAAGTFWIKGNLLNISSKDAVDGWIPAAKVEFSDAEIRVEFKQHGAEKARDILSLGAAKLYRPSVPTASLDRVTGIWRAGRAALPCQKVDPLERKF